MDKRYFHNGALLLEAFEPAKERQEATTPKFARSRPEVTPEKIAEPNEIAKHQPVDLQSLVASKRLLAISLPTCSQCDELASALALRGVGQEVFVKWDKGSKEYPELKAALSAFAGDKFTFPQVFADGIYQGGFAEVMIKLENGTYDNLFEEEFGAAPVTVKRMVDSRPMVAFSLPNCPQCDDLRAWLHQRGLPVDDIFVKWDKATPQYQSLKSQLIALTGQAQFTFPQTFVRAEYQGGFNEVIVKLEGGQFDEFFCDTFNVALPNAAAAAPEANLGFSVDGDEDF
mmetsp:Transcript_40310/g.73460  ORF Transcript_40310/g.73460 Transcript_40310/m.73460 type:complete len:286 (+) Transcript_40310:96-953(+)